MEYRDLKVIDGLCKQYQMALLSRDSSTVMKLLALIKMEMNKPMKPVPAWGAL